MAKPRAEGAGAEGAEAEGAWGTASEIRWTNLMLLRQQFQAEQERLFPGTAGQVFDKDFSAKLGLHPKYFGHIKARRRNVGNALARTCEDAFGKPIGWMDAVHGPAAAGGAQGEEQSSIQTFLELYRGEPARTRIMLQRELRERLAQRAAPPR